MFLKRVLITTATSAVLVGALGSPALAGEVTGNGKPTQGPAHARSVCAYSGLNDVIDEFEPTRTQNYGTFMKLFGKQNLPSPGVACNPNSGFEE